MNELTLWNRLIDRELLAPSLVPSLQAQFQEQVGPGPVDDSRIVEWLSQNKLITPWQQQVLLAGFDGPFRFGEYRVLGRTGPSSEVAFSAIHCETQFPVVLNFVSGTTTEDLEAWDSVCSRAATLQSIDNRSFLETYETVELPEYRFVVNEMTEAPSVAEKLGHKGRMPWQIAVAAIGKLARALDQLHQHGIAHQHIDSRTVVLESNGALRLRSPVTSVLPNPVVTLNGQKPNSADDGADPNMDRVTHIGTNLTAQQLDCFAVGNLLYRLIRGESIQTAATRHPGTWSVDDVIVRVSKYGLPTRLLETLREFAERDWRPNDPGVGELANRLAEISGNTIKKLSLPARSPAELQFISAISRWKPGSAQRVSAKVPSLSPPWTTPPPTILKPHGARRDFEFLQIQVFAHRSPRPTPANFKHWPAVNSRPSAVDNSCRWRCGLRPRWHLPLASSRS